MNPVDPLLARRDPQLIRRIFPWLAWLADVYYRAEVRGTDHLRDDASLVISTHNGGIFTPDAYCLAVAYWRRFGLEAPIFAMAHRQARLLPVLGKLFPRLGGVPASRDSARVVLEANYPCFVCPGGDIDTLKPFSQRHRVVFGGRTGFVSTAIRHQVPIVPVVSVGAHEVLFVLNDGRRLARLMGLTRLRVKTVPLALSFPLGLTIAGLPSLPLPSKVVVQVLPSIELREPPASADDPQTLKRCYDHVVQTMQTALTRLAAERRFPVLG